MAQEKDYFAFISYKREDEKWAEWLQDKLEHYRFPTNLNGRIDLPKNIRPTFRDVTDLKPGLLAEEINNALQNSEWLIVVCSPRSAKSPWVCKEAQTFINIGRADHIIPFVIEGSPFSNNPITECYPEAILNLTGSKELLAANINEMGRDAAAIKVVARMFNLRFDTLWQRHEREQRRKKRIWIGGALLLAFISLCIGAYIMQRNIALDRAKKSLERANSELKEEKDKTAQANDSISKQNLIILQQKNDLEKSNKELQETNIQLDKEKRKVTEQYAKLVAAKAYERISDNDYLKARMMHSEILPQLEADHRFSIIPEVEPVLRKSFESNSGIINAHTNSVSHALISPNGKYIVSCANYEDIKIWDVHTGLLKGSITNTDISPIIRFSPNGNLYISSDSTRVWSLNPLKRISSFKGKCVEDIDKDNRILIINPIEGNRQEVAIIDGNTGKHLTSFPISNNQEQITSAVFLYDNKIATSSLNDSIQIWDITTKKIVRGWKAHTNGVSFMHTDRDGICLLSGEFGKLSATEGLLMNDSLRLWDGATGKIVKKYPFSFSDAIFSPDDSRIIATDRNEIIILDVLSGKILKTLNKHNASITQIDVDSKGKLLVSASSDGVIRLWDDAFVGPTKEEYNFLINQVNGILVDPTIKGRHKDTNIYTAPVAFHPNGKSFIVSAVDSIIAYTTNPVTLITKFGKKHTAMVSSLKYDTNGKFFITTDGSATIWDATNYKPVRQIRAFKPKYAEISPDGTKALTVQRQNAVCIWDISKEDSVVDKHMAAHIFGENNNEVNMATFSPDSRHVITANSDGTIRIWNIINNIIEKSIIAHNSSVSTAFYSPDGKHIVSSSADKTIKIWDVKTGKCIKTLTDHVKEVCFAEYSKKGTYILSTSYDNTAKLWDVKTGISLKTIHSQGSMAAMSPNEDYILVVNSPGVFNIQPFPSFQQLIDRVKNLNKE